MSNPLEGFGQPRKLPTPFVWKVMAVVFALLAGLLAMYFTQGWMASNKAPETAGAVQARLQGVWTYTRPTDGEKPPYGWERWTFLANGLAIQSARPSDTAWGTPSNFGYEISRRKTADTGEWYWHVHAKDSAVDAALFKSGTLMASMGGGLYPLKKEDRDLAK